MPHDAKRFATLPEGPVDIVGDVHGEHDALTRLMRRLGYAPDGHHADGRRLVFVGDLTDRGHDSPAVVRLVRELVERDRARCLVGNHELNVLRDDPKEGNGWAFEADHDWDSGHFGRYEKASEAERREFRKFFASLPLALERSDLRLVHACWHEDSLAALKSLPPGWTVAEIFDRYEAENEHHLHSSGLSSKAAAEKSRWSHALKNPEGKPEMLLDLARADERRQMGNPIRVLTSGVERVGKAPFFSSGQWRFVDRVPWWNEYTDDVAVVVGHYWRWPVKVDRADLGKDGPDLFEDTEPGHWLGARRNVYCTDFSVGRRYKERNSGKPLGSTAKLGALRWNGDGSAPILFFDDDAPPIPTDYRQH